MGTLEKLAKAMLTALTEEDESGPGALSPSSPGKDREWAESEAEVKSAAIDLIERYASTLHYSTTRLGATVDDVEAAKAQIDIARMRLAARALRRMTPDYAPSEIVERNRAEAEMRARQESGANIPLPDTTPHPTMGSGYRYLEIPEEGSFAVSAAPQPPDEPGFFGLSTAQDSLAEPPAKCPKPPEPEDGWGDQMIAHMPCRSKAPQRTDNELYQCPNCNMLSRDGSTWWIYIPHPDEKQEETNESDD